MLIQSLTEELLGHLRHADELTIWPETISLTTHNLETSLVELSFMKCITLWDQKPVTQQLLEVSHYIKIYTGKTRFSERDMRIYWVM